MRCWRLIIALWFSFAFVLSISCGMLADASIFPYDFRLLCFHSIVKQRVATSTNAPIFLPQLKSIGQCTRYECIFECIWIHFAMGGWFTDPEFSTAEKLNTFKANAKRLFLLWMDGIWPIAKYPLMTWFLFIQRFSVGTSARIMT